MHSSALDRYRDLTLSPAGAQEPRVAEYPPGVHSWSGLMESRAHSRMCPERGAHILFRCEVATHVRYI